MTKMGSILMSDKETLRFFSVDIEASGPVPGLYSMLSIGVCAVDDPDLQFYRELRPTTLHNDPDALAVTGFHLEQLMEKGTEALIVMRELSAWVACNTPDQKKAVFAGFNAAFDWSFVNWYFHYTGVKNPFGHAPLDIKSLLKGVLNLAWLDCRTSVLAAYYCIERKDDHHALQDSIFQAALLRAILNETEVP